MCVKARQMKKRIVHYAQHISTILALFIQFCLLQGESYLKTL